MQVLQSVSMVCLIFLQLLIKSRKSHRSYLADRVFYAPMPGGERAIDLDNRIGNFFNGRRPTSSLLTRMMVKCQPGLMMVWN